MVNGQRQRIAHGIRIKESLAEKVRERKIMPGDLREITSKNLRKNRGGISAHRIVNGFVFEKQQFKAIKRLV